MSKPILSICIITYNHEKFIRKSIESVCNQNTNFEIEIIVADDFSTDNTRAIILETTKKYNHTFNFIFQEKNVGPADNFIQLISSAKGKYIAYLEGDDYWTDDNKLQKQVDYLEANPNTSLIAHNYFSFDFASNKKTDHQFPQELLEFSFNGLINLYGVLSLTIVFRNYPNLFNTYISKFKDSPMGDLPLFYMLAEKGNLAKLPDVMACHVTHSGGTYSMIGYQKQLEKYTKTVEFINAYSNNKHAFLFQISLLNISYKKFYSTNKTLLNIPSLLAQATKLIFWRLRYINEQSIYYSTKDILYFLFKYKSPSE